MTGALPNGLRSVHAGTNLSSNLGHRFSYGIVSLEPPLLLGSLCGSYSTPWSEGT